MNESNRRYGWLIWLGLAGFVLVCGQWAVAAPRTTKSKAPTAQQIVAQQVEMFQAMKDGQLDVRFIPANDREGRVLFKNNTKRPLSVRLPDGFAGVPVLAQIGGGGRNRDGGNNNNNQNQTTAGGFGGGGQQGGGGFFNIAPEKSSQLKVACVCLEHGKADPNPKVPYDIKPIESYTKDPQVRALVNMFGRGELNQRSTQAAAWHLANKMSWDALAKKEVDRLGRQDTPYFNRAELEEALQIVNQVKQVTRGETEQNSPGESASLSSKVER